MPEIELVDASRLRRWERILRATMLVALGSLLAASVVIVIRPTIGNAPAPYAYVAPTPASLPALPLRLPLVEVSPEVLAGLKVAGVQQRKADRRAERRSERRDRREQKDQREQKAAATTDVRDAGTGTGTGTASVAVQPAPGASPSPVSGPAEPAPTPAPAPMPAPQPVSTDSHRLKEVVDPVESTVKKVAADAVPDAAPVVDAVFDAANGLLGQLDEAAPATDS